MADNTILNAGSGGDTIATDDVSGVKYQRVKLVDGTLDSTAAIPGDAANGLDVDVTRMPATAADGATGLPATTVVIAGFDGTNVQAIVTDSTGRPTVNINGTVPVSGTVTANAGTGPWPITDNSGSLTVDAPVGTPAFVRLSDGSAAITTLPVSIAAVVHVDDNSGSLTVDAPLATPVFTTLTPSTTGGWSKTTALAQTTTKKAVKASAGTFGGYYAYNPNATVAYIQVFDVASGSVTLGTTAPDLVFAIPATSAANLEIANGINMATAITLACTTTATGSTSPGTGLDLTILFK